jgi:hypothetical protein
VLEDDVDLTSDRLAEIKLILEEAPADWGAVSLGCNYVPPGARRVSSRLIDLGGVGLYGAHAVVYRRAAAKAYVDDAVRTGLTEPWDLWLAHSAAAKLYVAAPPLVGVIPVCDFTCWPTCCDSDTQGIR